MINCKGNVIGILKVLSSSANEDDDAGRRKAGDNDEDENNRVSRGRNELRQFRFSYSGPFYQIFTIFDLLYFC